ncbi:MAG: 1-(5-phosphoribosyl)-5-[(5-phosphoribosylamino)methylideneamino] imidazole-4-carboxamide isomerase [Euryarchaeota archaeon]|nr:1-(5-phosphoribosyl)-5-[(5-phosphoribosylamino)methylideneamino] imidazole-4-carboxamide isomerase [Euryarchaeota archaeon]
MFRVFPAVDIRGGKCVTLEQGRPDRVLVERPDPVAVAREWVRRGARCLHVVDLDAVFGTGENTPLLGAIRQAAPGVFIQAGGGIRSLPRAEQVAALGPDRVILGTAAVEDPTVLYRVRSKLPKERVMVAVDGSRGMVLSRGWARSTGISIDDFVGRAAPWVGALLYTDVDVEGQMKGVRSDSIRQVVECARVPVVVAGGVATLEDVKRAREAGAAGCVIGLALYNNSIRLEDALKLEAA